MFCFCQLPLELSLSQQSIPVFFIHKVLLMVSSIYKKRGKRFEQNIYWMVPSSEIAQACNFFIQFQITYQLNTKPIALLTKEINWTLILHLPYALSPKYPWLLPNYHTHTCTLIFYWKSWKTSQRDNSDRKGRTMYVYGGFKVDYSVSPGTWL